MMVLPVAASLSHLEPAVGLELGDEILDFGRQG